MLLKQEPCQVILGDSPIKQESEEPNEQHIDDMFGNFFSCDTLPSSDTVYIYGLILIMFLIVYEPWLLYFPICIIDRSDIQLARQNLNNTVMEREVPWKFGSSSFWNQINQINDSIIKSSNAYLHENSRNFGFGQTLENNIKIFEESAQSILELRKKEDIELKKMRKLCEENKKL
jgi:hypothetical protein